jgi:hypothetical protein
MTPGDQPRLIEIPGLDQVLGEAEQARQPPAEVELAQAIGAVT